MNFIGRTTIFISLFLLLGHMLTPHLHSEQGKFDACIHTDDHARSLIEIIGCFFHPDLGSDHLEDFTAVDHSQLVAYIPTREFPGFYAAASFALRSGSPAFVSRAFAMPPPERGPPSVV